MAKQIIVLERTPTNEGPSWTVAFWASVPAAKQTFWAGHQTTSIWKGASAGENTAIANGQVREIVNSFTQPAGITLPQMQAILIDHFGQWQAFVNSDSAYSRYGTYYDGTSWTVGGA